MRPLAILLALGILTACVPALPGDTPAAGAILTATEQDVGTLYRVDLEEPVERLFLRFHGEGLDANAPECSVTPSAIECVIGEAQSFYEITVAGDVQNDPALPYGVVCRRDCYPLFLRP